MGRCFENGTHGIKTDVSRARDLYRLSAEKLCNEAMSNLAELHAKLLDFESAARWCDAAYKYGWPKAKVRSEYYRNLVKKLATSTASSTDKINLGSLLLEEFNIVTGHESPSMAVMVRKPSLNELISIPSPSPYVRSLIDAKKLLQLGLNSMVGDLKFAVQCFADAKRIPDSFLIIDTMEKEAIKLVVDRFIPITDIDSENFSLLAAPTSPDWHAQASYYEQKHAQFPNCFKFTTDLGCHTLGCGPAYHKQGLNYLHEAFQQLPKPNDDANPLAIDLLYNIGAGYRVNQQYEMAKKYFQRFLKHGPANGHRKVAEAYYQLGLSTYWLSQIEDKSQLLADMNQCISKGDIALKALPNFLHQETESPNRRLLMNKIKLLSISRPMIENGENYGGDVIEGPKRHPSLRSPKPYYLTLWRKNKAKYLKSLEENETKIATTLRLAKSTNTTRNLGSEKIEIASLSPASIDEMLSFMEDHIFTDKYIDCVVVTVPYFSGHSHQFIIEDSYRDPMQISIYNMSKNDAKLILPGIKIRLIQPYLRFAQDETIWFRVDKPEIELQLNEMQKLCWTCLKMLKK
ncbi:hypothetical protein HK096_003238, partial [Nowakowskiella sp. JEL0078]